VRLPRLVAAPLALGLVLTSSVLWTGVASAATAPYIPNPVAYPGSAVPVINNVSDPMWDKTITGLGSKTVPSGLTDNALKVGGTVGEVGTVSKLAVAVRGAGVAGAAVSAFMVGTQVGTGIASAVGLPTSGDFFCDVMTLAANSNCAMVPNPVYTVNSDALPISQGWRALPRTVTAEGGGVSADVVAPPASTYGSKTGLLSLTNAYSGLDAMGVLGGYPAFSGGYYTTLSTYCIGTSGGSAPASASVNPKAGGGVSGSLSNGRAGQVFENLNAAYSCSYGLYGVLFHVNASTLTRKDSASAAAVTVADVSAFDVWWDPPGSPNRQDVEADPARNWLTKTKCEAGVDVSKSVTFHETDPEWPPIPQAQCADGAVQSVQVYQQTVGMSDTLVYDWTAPAETEVIPTEYPNCATGACQLILSRVTSPTTTVSCFSSPDLCTEWWTETEKATTNTSTYRCTYGTYVVDLIECAVYAKTFKTGQYSNPRTGPAEDPEPTNPAQEDGCPPPFSWGALFNPWYYYKGALCALQDAFVPKTSLGTRISTTGTSIRRAFPFSLFAGMAGVAVGGASSCPDWKIKVDALDKNVVCNSTFTQSLRNNRPLLLVLMSAAAFAPLLRSLWYAAVPVLRVVPTGGK